MYQSQIKHVFLMTSPISNIYCDISFLSFTPDTRYFMNTNFSLAMNTYIETSIAANNVLYSDVLSES